MQPQSTPNAQQFPMHELEQIESAIQASRHWIAALEGRRETLTAELERLTRPQPIVARAEPQERPSWLLWLQQYESHSTRGTVAKAHLGIQNPEGDERVYPVGRLAACE
jgi:hypothetical protein